MMLAMMTVTKDNVMELMQDTKVYVIKPYSFDQTRFRMDHISECAVKDILSDEFIVVKITN